MLFLHEPIIADDTIMWQIDRQFCDIKLDSQWHFIIKWSANSFPMQRIDSVVLYCCKYNVQSIAAICVFERDFLIHLWETTPDSSTLFFIHSFISKNKSILQVMVYIGYLSLYLLLNIILQ